MNIASVRLRWAGCVVATLLLACGCATKSPSSPQVPMPPASPSSTPSPSPPKPPTPSPPSSSSGSSSSSSSKSESPAPSGAKGAQSPAQKPAAGPGSASTSPSSQPATPAGGTQAAGGAKAGGGAKTEAEQNAAWDDAFYGSLGQFDERLSKEQAAIEKRRGEIVTAGNGRGSESGDGGAGGGVGMSGQVPSEVSTAETGGAPARGTGSESSVLGGPGGPGTAASTGPKFPPPEGTPDGRDDDVVARQLREAAETEKDPELRARLWDEYRKYKARKS